MPYVEGFTVHDADSHVMELPGEIDRYVEPGLRAAFSEAIRKPGDLTGWEDKARALQDDPEFRSGDEANLLLRKNYQALGAFRREDRPRSLDLLGFASQLVFTTHALGNYGLEESGQAELALAGAQSTAGCWRRAMSPSWTSRRRPGSPGRPSTWAARA